MESGGTRRSTEGEVKGKEANGVGSQQSGTVSEHGLSSITTADAHNLAASSRLNWHLRQYKWTRPFRWKTKCGFCACTITFHFHSNFFKTQMPIYAYDMKYHFRSTSKRLLIITLYHVKFFFSISADRRLIATEVERPFHQTLPHFSKEK